MHNESENGVPKSFLNNNVAEENKEVRPKFILQKSARESSLK